MTMSQPPQPYPNNAGPSPYGAPNYGQPLSDIPAGTNPPKKKGLSVWLPLSFLILSILVGGAALGVFLSAASIIGEVQTFQGGAEIVHHANADFTIASTSAAINPTCTVHGSNGAPVPVNVGEYGEFHVASGEDTVTVLCNPMGESFVISPTVETATQSGFKGIGSVFLGFLSSFFFLIFIILSIVWIVLKL